MRHATSLLRRLGLCAALVLVASCGWGGPDDGESGRLPAAPMGVTAAAGSATQRARHVERGVHGRRRRPLRGVSRHHEGQGSAGFAAHGGCHQARARPPGTSSPCGPATPRAASGRRSREVRATTPAAVAADRSAPTRPGRPRGRAVGQPGRPAVLGRLHGRPGRGCRTTSTRAARRSTVWAATRRRPWSRGCVRAPATPSPSAPGTRPTTSRRRRHTVRLTTPGTDDGRDTAPTGFRGDEPPRRRGVPPRPGLGPAAHGRCDHRVPGPARRQPRPPRWCSAGTAPRDRATYSFYLGGRPGSATGCGSGRSCPTAPGAASRRSGR